MQNNIYKEDIRLLRKVKSENRLIMFVEVNISKKIICLYHHILLMNDVFF